MTAGPEVQSLSSRPVKIMGYGLTVDPFFVMANPVANIWVIFYAFRTDGQVPEKAYSRASEAVIPMR